MFTETEKRLLLSTARKAIESALNNKPNPELSDVSPSLSELCGAFVTLFKKGELRGCIGYLTGVMPLIDTIRDVAVKAALSDPRFAPLTADELPDISIEISILSPLKHIRDVEEIQVGKHGILIEGMRAKGVLLPQVAVEHKWDRERFLKETSLKAGGPPDLWKKPGVKIFIFTSEIIDE